ncbi:MAG: HAD hydrolase family protein [Treponema sp.]|nr:HAD hydrolase family protein [Treponema sp.]
MNKNIKMIVTDLDETLFKTDKTVSENTINTLKECRKKGIKVVYATGRGKSAEQNISSSIFDGRIIMNGAIAQINDDVIYYRVIPCQSVRSLLIACDKYGLKIASQFNGMDY